MKIDIDFVIGWSLLLGVFVALSVMLLLNIEGVLAFWHTLSPCYGWSGPSRCMLI